jgi:hypothetical protein
MPVGIARLKAFLDLFGDDPRHFAAFQSTFLTPAHEPGSTFAALATSLMADAWPRLRVCFMRPTEATARLLLDSTDNSAYAVSSALRARHVAVIAECMREMTAPNILRLEGTKGTRQSLAFADAINTLRKETLQHLEAFVQDRDTEPVKAAQADFENSLVSRGATGALGVLLAGSGPYEYKLKEVLHDGERFSALDVYIGLPSAAIANRITQLVNSGTLRATATLRSRLEACKKAMTEAERRALPKLQAAPRRG